MGIMPWSSSQESKGLEARKEGRARTGEWRLCKVGEGMRWGERKGSEESVTGIFFSGDS